MILYQKKLTQLFLFSLVLFLNACVTPPPPAADTPAIIPQVLNIKENKGVFEITQNTMIAVQNERQEKIAKDFFSHFSKVARWTPRVIIGEKGDIRFLQKEDISKEGYELLSTKEGIEVYAKNDAGFFYALQTLAQLLPTEFVTSKRQKKTRWVVPLVSIRDQPRFAWRGFMLDVSRHFYKKEDIKKVLDQMAALKLNTFHWHLTDDQGWRIEIKKYPKLTEVGAWRVNYNTHEENINQWWGRPKQKEGDKADYGGFYTQDEIREIIAYAKERFITVIPEIDIPGHSQAIIASYPEIACKAKNYYVATGGVFKDNTICPGKEFSFEFVEGVLNELMDLFPSQYIHIGGDECNKAAWKADPDCQKRIKEEGLKDEKELQSYFIKRVEKIINARDRTMIGWDEILEGGLAPNATVMSWRGEKGGIEAASSGHHVVMSPNKYCYLDLKQGHTDNEPNFGYSQCLLSTCYHYNPIPESLKDKKELILGVQGNLWTESLPDWDKLNYMTYPRLYAVAENAWSSQHNENWDDFINRLYPQLERLQHQNIRYANSAFNVWIDHVGNGDSIVIDLHTEANDLEIKYTLDGTEPNMESLSYHNKFKLEKSALLKAAAFRNGEMAGKVTQKEFFVHKAKGAKVIYHRPYRLRNKGDSDQALVDLNFGSNWSADSLWQSFNQPLVEVDIVLEKEQEIENVQMNFLQVAISGIYMPEEITLLSSVDGKQFRQLKDVSLSEFAKVQGRYIHQTKIAFPKTKLKVLKLKFKTVKPIYKGHFREGKQSKMYIDEIVVF